MAAIASTTQTKPGIASTIWDALTKPHPSITDTAERRRATITSALLLALAFSFSVLLVILPTISVIIPVVLVFTGYGLSRSRHTNFGIVLSIFAYILAIFWQMYNVTDWATASALGYMVWLIVPVVLSSLLFPPRITFRIVVALIISVYALRFILLPTMPTSTFGVAAGFVTMLSAIITLASYLQEFYFVRPRLAELKKAQQELESKNRALELANAEIKDFSYMIAHDLRSPLVNMTEYVNEIRYSLDAVKPAIDAGLPTLTTEQRSPVQLALQSDLPESLGYLDTSAKRLNSLVGEILRLARIGQRESTREKVNLRTMVDSIIKRYPQKLTSDAVTVRGLPEQIEADRVIVEEVITNLVDNAVKYAHADRPLHLEISADPKPESVTVHVKDNGRGIPTAEESNVFMPFRRASNTGDVEGTGVGLYYVRALVERQGGRIWFKSEPGAGTTFSFSIAIATPGVQ